MNDLLYADCRTLITILPLFFIAMFPNPPYQEPNSHHPPPPSPFSFDIDIDSDLKSLESTIQTLQELGKRKPLQGEEKRRSEEAARTTREYGLTDEQSSILSNGGFAPATIKEKARGAKVFQMLVKLQSCSTQYDSASSSHNDDDDDTRILSLLVIPVTPCRFAIHNMLR